MASDTSEEPPKPLFRNLNADDPDPEASVIESLCLNCGENGTTKLLLTKIPFYKEVVLMSFECPHCGFKNNEMQSAGEIAEKGLRITLKVESERDLNRQVVKSDYTSVQIPEVDFEIPSQSQKGEVTTVEGVIDRAINGLTQDQDTRSLEDPDVAKQIDEFVKKLQKLKQVGDTHYTMIFEDISGNTFVSNPHMPHKDPNCDVVSFVRTTEQNHTLGILPAQGESIKFPGPTDFVYEDLQSEVLQFLTNCPHCATACDTNMKLTNIPHFKEVVIMATNCEACGHRTNEVKSGGGIEPLGQRIAVKVHCKEDLSRDVLKSETCSLEIPELDLEVGPAALGGRFTTVEGLVGAMKDQLIDNGAMFSDSAEEEGKTALQQFVADMEKILVADKPFTIILDDPAGNSYVQSLTYPDLDPNLEVTKYERTHDQNDILGLNDIKTEDYESS
ncbi:zinc finger protein ZPR1 [Macrosteles quadrilineatus]|uniref:zinc finger protein ZPR1 n=1 Tax=Macrosteles quadrilineatus TaxID=74068 RepID=UPI0023E1CA48|nr:zinc finger protein ZPR1 [Macrosteles quadrilineatus]